MASEEDLASNDDETSKNYQDTSQMISQLA